MVNWLPHEDSGHLLTGGPQTKPEKEPPASLLGRISGGLKAAILSESL